MKKWLKNITGITAKEQELEAKELEVIKVRDPKAYATRKKEPWVNVLDMQVNEDNIRNGFFELDWNKYFIEELIKWKKDIIKANNLGNLLNSSDDNFSSADIVDGLIIEAGTSLKLTVTDLVTVSIPSVNEKVKEYISFYNTKRRHTEIGKVPPNEIYYQKAIAC